MRIIAYSLIVLGILTMLYPTLSDLYSNFQQKRLLKIYENQITEEKHNQAIESYRELGNLFEQKELEAGVDEAFLPTEEGEARDLPLLNEMIGTMQINKINLHLPILAGATQSNLIYAAGYLEGTTPLGEEGNMAIAAHRSYTFGKLFNRLDELEQGDQVVISSKEATYTYTIHKKFLVDPSDTSVLRAPQSGSIVTLITCHPMKDPTHRLIIQAELEP